MRFTPSVNILSHCSFIAYGDASQRPEPLSGYDVNASAPTMRRPQTCAVAATVFELPRGLFPQRHSMYVRFVCRASAARSQSASRGRQNSDIGTSHSRANSRSLNGPFPYGSQ